MDGSRNDRVGGSRRDFLKTAALAGGSAALAPAASAWGAPGDLPLVTLGKTGQKVPALGMGTSWSLQPSFVQAALAAGIRYIDCSESYEGGACEKVLGEVFARNGRRKDVDVVSKNSRDKQDSGGY